MESNVAYIQVSKSRWLQYSEPADIIQTSDLGQVCSAFSEVEQAVESGKYAVGYISYEASPAFDPSLSVNSSSGIPLLWFAVCDNPTELSSPAATDGNYSTGEWKSDISEPDYLKSIGRIKEYIKNGDTYQVNFTQRLHSDFSGDPYSYFYALANFQRGRNCAFLDIGDHAICSASPELFIALNGKSLKSCPMKGTARRGLTYEQDVQAALDLQSSEKNRAENIMIVDMIRNDMGRIADVGTVRVESACDIEKYPTVLQMTSTVRADTSAPLLDIMKAMFPCSSITGAPKVRTMEIIRELEHGPRGIYTGAIGCMAPGRKALFNVAIRTVVIDKNAGKAEYGVGGGIVWDSEGGSEFAECFDKTRVLTSKSPDFKLLETMLWDGEDGYFLMDYHLERAKHSAEYFGIELDLDDLMNRLKEYAQSISVGRYRVRMLIDQQGRVELESTELHDAGAAVFRLAVAPEPVDSSNRFLYHKTTNRSVYENAKKDAPDYDDVVLYNERGEVTETTIANIVVSKDSRMITPPVECGLLPGTMRAHLLKKGEIEEGIITLADLKDADDIYIINSVRGMLKALLTITP